MKALIVPGNPPAQYFYDLWSKELGTHVEVAYPFFSRDIEDSKQYFEKVVEVYEQELLKEKEPVHLVGHSLGAFYSLELLSRNPEKVAQCSLVCPFFIKPHRRALGILKLMHWVHKRPALEELLVKYRRLFKIFYPDLIHLHKHEFHECFRVAYHTHQALDYEKYKDIPQELIDKVKIVYTGSDMWCSKKMMKQWGPQVEKVNLKQIRHDFVVIKKQRALVAKTLGI